MGHGLAYSRDELLQLCSTAPPTAAVLPVYVHWAYGLSAACNVVYKVVYGLRGRHLHVTRCLSVVTGPTRSGRFRPPPSPQPLLSTLSPSPPSRACADRDSRAQGKLLNFGCLNIRSLQDKVDNLLDVRAYTVSTSFSSRRHGPTVTRSASAVCAPRAFKCSIAQDHALVIIRLVRTMVASLRWHARESD